VCGGRPAEQLLAPAVLGVLHGHGKRERHSYFYPDTYNNLHIVIEKQNLLIIVYQFPIYETKMSSKKNDDINFNVQKF